MVKPKRCRSIPCPAAASKQFFVCAFAATRTAFAAAVTIVVIAGSATFAGASGVSKSHAATTSGVNDRHVSVRPWRNPSVATVSYLQVFKSNIYTRVNTLDCE